MEAAQQADELAAKAAKTVRRVVADAEDSASVIVREAEVEAASIRERAEADASQIRERAEAYARGQIEAASAANPKATGDGDDAAPRMVAMKMAVDGQDRAAIEGELNERFGATDRSALLDEVLSRAAQLSRH
jgi:cell division septum initiation protein DivIVA